MILRKCKVLKILGLMAALFSVCIIGGCTFGGGEDTGKLRDLEFTVVGEAEQPDALKDVIEEKKAKPFQVSYTLGEDMYIAVGYGEQATGGYSICVNELYETEDSIVLDTTLTGPEQGEQTVDTPTYPYIVVKTENIEDKNIKFE